MRTGSTCKIWPWKCDYAEFQINIRLLAHFSKYDTRGFAESNLARASKSYSILKFKVCNSLWVVPFDCEANRLFKAQAVLDQSYRSSGITHVDKHLWHGSLYLFTLTWSQMCTLGCTTGVGSFTLHFHSFFYIFHSRTTTHTSANCFSVRLFFLFFKWAPWFQKIFLQASDLYLRPQKV